MGLFRTALCAALIVLAPMTAQARWPTHHGWRHHHRSSGYWPRHRRETSRYDAWSETCGLELRDARGRLERCRAARAAFERENPCPSTGLPRGACPGWVVDHIVPLKRGGADDPSNMQWQTAAEAKDKDRVE